MYDLRKFTLTSMAECTAAMRALGAGAHSIAEVAQRMVRHLHEHLIDSHTGAKACALVRFYKTHPYGELDAELSAFARSMLGDHAESPTMKCLILLATVGEKPEWNSRATSLGHKAIPLPSEQFVAQIPMLSQLVRQFGLPLGAVLNPDPAVLVEIEQRTYNVFHVADAVGSPFVPAQRDFVAPFGINSVLGFGGVLPNADLFAIIMFSKVPIPRETAEMFRTVALSAKVAVLPFVGRPLFG